MPMTEEEKKLGGQFLFQFVLPCFGLAAFVFYQIAKYDPFSLLAIFVAANGNLGGFAETKFFQIRFTQRFSQFVAVHGAVLIGHFDFVRFRNSPI
jgi:hypothetical protein